MINACKKCRREGEKLILKGDRCLSAKCAMTKRPYAPGQHGQGNFKKTSEYCRQLREKQKARRIYNIGERQFKNIVKKADKMVGNTAENMLILLETRIDSLAYRLGFGLSRSNVRQMISHGRLKINGQKIKTPSITVKVGDIIEACKKETLADVTLTKLSWADVDAKSEKATIKSMPTKDEIDSSINESLIIEFYSR
ncbi:MAG: 30S ribosomal protein S4 [Candidatus Berkelbacteria bacterium]